VAAPDGKEDIFYFMETGHRAADFLGGDYDYWPHAPRMPEACAVHLLFTGYGVILFAGVGEHRRAHLRFRGRTAARPGLSFLLGLCPKGETR